MGAYELTASYLRDDMEFEKPPNLTLALQNGPTEIVKLLEEYGEKE